MIPMELLVTLTVAAAFYVAIPGAGAFVVRRRWRQFREALLISHAAPPLRYGVSSKSSRDRVYRFFGQLEAIQRDHTIWVGDHTLSVKVSLDGVPVFVMPRTNPDGAGPTDETPRVLYWKELTALAEGTDVFVGGSIIDDQGSIRVNSGPFGVPLVMIFDGPAEALFSRAMWAGRQRNEYWNHLTPISLIGGFVAELLWAVNLSGQSRLHTVVALVMALTPLLPLFPPGVIGFYWYRRLWRRARRIRAHRDLAMLRNRAHDELPLRYGQRSLSRIATRWELAAVTLLLGAIGINGYFSAVLFALLMQ
ncbi:MAG: hypothetical protein ACOCYB_03235 [Alkalispirochaeta sp.]